MSSVVIAGDISGSVTLDAPSVAGTTVLTLPATSGTVVTTATTSGISGSAITTGTVATNVGGTGITSFTANGAMYATSTSALTTGTLPVTSGGTGASALTANNVILGNGTSAVQFVAPGSSGNVLTSNGTTWTSAAAGGGAFRTDIFTTPGTWTRPASATLVKVTVVGGGGANNTGAPGSGRGGVAIASNVPVTGPVAVTIGGGGVYFPTTPGGTSSFGSLVSATGGGGNPGPNSPGSGTVSAGTTLKIGHAGDGLIVGSSVPTNSVIPGNRGGATYTVSSVGASAGSGAGASSGGWAGVVIVEYVG